MEVLAMISIPVDFPLVITTHPLFIVLAYLSQIFSLLIAIGMIFARKSLPSIPEEVKRNYEKRGLVPPDQRDQESWRARLYAFHVIPHDDENAILEEVMATWRLLVGPSALVFSLTAAVLTLVNLCLFIFTRGAVFTICQCSWF